MGYAGREQIEGGLMDYDDEIERVIDELILSGGLEVAGLDPETNEPLYQFTDKLKETNPDVAASIQELFHMHIMALWERGFVNLNPMEENPMVTITEFALDEDAIQTLHPDLRRTLFMIMARMQEDG